MGRLPLRDTHGCGTGKIIVIEAKQIADQRKRSGSLG
jgi:hypothetical protein